MTAMGRSGGLAIGQLRARECRSPCPGSTTPTARRAMNSDQECASQKTETVATTQKAVLRTSGSSSGPVAAMRPATTMVP